MAEAIGSLILPAIGIAATAAVTIGTVSISAATIVGTVVLVGGSIGLQMLLAPDEPTMPTAQRQTPSGRTTLPTPESGHVPLRQAIPPRTVAYGRVRLSGTYVLFEANDGVSWDVVAFHHGQIEAFAGFYLHDDVVQLTTLSGGTVMGLIDGRYGGSHINIDTRIGLATNVAYPQPSAAMPEIWGPAMRGDELASIMLQCLPTTTPSEFSVIYPRGKPEPSVVVDAKPIVDHRSSTTTALMPRGQNPVNQLIDYLTNDDYGMGLDFDTLIAPVLADLNNEANLCEGVVIRASSLGEYRYMSCGAFQIDSDPADVVGAILDTCDGWISENGDGTLALKVGVYRPPTVTFLSKHIRGINLQYDLADEEAINELSVDYCEPRLDYKTVTTDPWRNEDDIAERGRVRSQRLSLPWVQSFTQARRLAKRRDAQNNAAFRGSLTTTLFGLQALGERWVRVQAPELPDMADMVIEVRSVTIDLLNSTMTFKFISIDEDTIDDWSPSEEGADIVIPPKLISATPPPIDPVGPGGLNAEAYRSAFEVAPLDTAFGAVAFDDPHRPDLTYQVQFRVAGSSDAFFLEGDRFPVGPPPPFRPPFGSPQPDPAKIGIYCLLASNGAVMGQTYEIQIRSVPPGGAAYASAWSSSMFIST